MIKLGVFTRNMLRLPAFRPTCRDSNHVRRCVRTGLYDFREVEFVYITRLPRTGRSAARSANGRIVSRSEKRRASRSIYRAMYPGPSERWRLPWRTDTWFWDARGSGRELPLADREEEQGCGERRPLVCAGRVQNEILRELRMVMNLEALVKSTYFALIGCNATYRM